MDPKLLEELDAAYGAEAVSTQLHALERHGDVVDDPELWLRTALSADFKYMPIEDVRRCACGSERHARLSRFVFWNLLAVRQCAECGLVFVSPRLTREAMNRVFNEHYFDYSDPEYWGRRRLPVFRDVGRLLRRHGCQSVFDVGSAYGHFVKWVADEGLVASGCDISRAAVEWGRKNLNVELLHGEVADLDPGGDRYDCAVSLDSLYYAADPAADLRAMRTLVKPSGHVILRLRNNHRVASRARHEGRKPIGQSVIPMPHVWAFTPETITELLRRCGFEVVSCEAAASSRRIIPALDQATVLANRLLMSWPLRLGPRTLSFNVVATREDSAGF